MKAVMQRVDEASVSVNGKTVSEIGCGWLILIGVSKTDSEQDAKYLAEKTLYLRMFSDNDDKFNLNILDIKGEILVVSQFTLLADSRKGRRPNFQRAAEPNSGKRLYEAYVENLKKSGLKIMTGIFGANMKVRLINSGPVTIIIDSEKTGFETN